MEEVKRGRGRPKGSKNKPKPLVIETASVAPNRRALSIKEMANVYGVSHSTIENEIRAGNLIARKLGDRTVIIAEDEERWRHGLARRALFSPRRGVSEEDAPQ